MDRESVEWVCWTQREHCELLRFSTSEIRALTANYIVEGNKSRSGEGDKGEVTSLSKAQEPVSTSTGLAQRFIMFWIPL